ncbi:hypothetical protein [Nocardia niigatensis]|uniref:hypothetical protein n=1 Tax=Nocardia niigatensis TaxID=209249 RepID=UPI000316CD38|nr:hypothetical protein [Nocardia niigatensis]
MTTFLFTRWRMFGAATLGRFVTAVVLAVVTAAAPLLPEIVTLAAVTAILAGLNAFEYWVVSTGRPLLLMQRTRAS